MVSAAVVVAAQVVVAARKAEAVLMVAARVDHSQLVQMQLLTLEVAVVAVVMPPQQQTQ
jgi:hypothetical protein